MNMNYINNQLLSSSYILCIQSTDKIWCLKCEPKVVWVLGIWDSTNRLSRHQFDINIQNNWLELREIIISRYYKENWVKKFRNSRLIAFHHKIRPVSRTKDSALIFTALSKFAITYLWSAAILLWQTMIIITLSNLLCT